jgi:streptomycin 6-kinase
LGDWGSLVDLEMVPSSLPVVATVRRQPGGSAWLAELPSVISALCSQWSLRVGAPLHGGSCSWVAPAWTSAGGEAILKVTWPHREALGEAAALRLWDGRGAVRLLRSSQAPLAVLVERCSPGVMLGSSGLDAEECLLIGAQLLDELWAAGSVSLGSGLLEMGSVTGEWACLVEEREGRIRPGFDPGLVSLGAGLLRSLPARAARQVVVHGDFNPGNVLSAQRRPWLAIDAKPMIGDPGYDLWPLVGQIDDPFAYADPCRVLRSRFALVGDVVGEDVRRLAGWALAREVEFALWAADHADSAAGYLSMDRARVYASLAQV